MKNKMNAKQWVKIATLSTPIIALVVATMTGLEEGSQAQIESILLQAVALIAGAIGVTGVIANNDKEDQE